MAWGEMVDFAKFNRHNFLKLDITTKPETNLVTCLVCNETLAIAMKDEFVPYRVRLAVTKYKISKLIETNKEAFKWFAETHYHQCVHPCKD